MSIINKKLLFNTDWEFAKSDINLEDEVPLSYTPVDIPHDWQIYDTLHLNESSIGWYRRVFHFDQKMADKVFLFFDGVYMDSTLYVNNQYVGEWKYGYTSFEHDISQMLHEGENEILMKVVYQSPNSRWYSGAGIYRNVWLLLREENYIETDGIYVSINNQEENWKVDIDTDVHLTEMATLTHCLYDGNEKITSCSSKIEERYNNQKLAIQHPKRWSINSPNLYQLETTLSIGDVVMETVSQNIGFRTLELTPDQGFYLNGEQMKINGVCEHHDLGALGAAFNVYAAKYRMEKLQEMGVNAIRISHNMPAKEIMQLADEMGFLIVTEAFDMWERPKTTYDYARFFKEWAFKDVDRWVKRDRNHPSLLMWSIGNEIYDTHADEYGQEITKRLLNYVRQFDPKENAVVTIGSNFMPWENAQNCADIVKFAGYNYAEKYYQDHHEKHPDWVIYGSETGSVVQSRGIYHFPYDKSILADDDEQCSSLGNSATSWGAKSTEANIVIDKNMPFSLGQFIWTGYDYIGEPTPYHTKNSFLGQLDTATFPKDSYYMYQAGWTDYKTAPMVHLFPYWDFNEGQIIDVRAASNAPKIELQLNGETIGVHKVDFTDEKNFTAWWQVPYQKGELKAIAYDEQDNVIATDIRQSFGDAAKINVSPHKHTLIANGEDIIFVELAMEDNDGNPVENATNRVEVNVSGAGRLVGLDNGDSSDYDQYKGTSRRLFSGKLMAMVAAKLVPGPIHLEVTSEGLKKQAIQLNSVATDDNVDGISAFTENKKYPIVMGYEKEIPVRKLDIYSEAGQLFNQEKNEMMVEVNLYPKNTDYQEVEWSVVTDTGIESNISTIEPKGHKAKVTALGDGKFRVRCTTKNGTNKTKLISELEFKAEGLGTAYKDPYDFISAGLYDFSKGEVGNGNERGIATSRDGVTEVGFHEIDFGSVGSDVITIPIFALSSEVYPLEIWEGVPGEEGSELLADTTYQKESKWNVYQEETYQLSRRLKGITSICFVTNKKMHIKGFSFEKFEKAFEENLAINADHIYGDSFIITEENVENIGNNVSLKFHDLDFGEKGMGKIIIDGHSPIEKNTLHIHFENEAGDSKQIVEITKTNGYEKQMFEIDKITGKQHVTFIFLPGSNFDFKSFQFLEK